MKRDSLFDEDEKFPVAGSTYGWFFSVILSSIVSTWMLPEMDANFSRCSYILFSKSHHKRKAHKE